MLRAVAAAIAIAIIGLAGCERGSAAATPRTVEFVVEGMHCDGCAEAIVHSVTDLKGVVGCRVDHEGGTASIDVQSNDPQIDALVAEAIAKLGFVVRKPATPGSGSTSSQP